MGRVELHDVWPNVTVFGLSVTRHFHRPNRRLFARYQTCVLYTWLVYGIIVDAASCVFLRRIFQAFLRPGDIVTVAFDYTPCSPIPASSHDVTYRGLLSKCVLTIWLKVGNCTSRSGRVFRYFCYGFKSYVRIRRSVNFVWDLRLARDDLRCYAVHVGSR